MLHATSQATSRPLASAPRPLLEDRMKNIPATLACLIALALPASALAWDGFDAETTGLVEIRSEIIPVSGEVVEVYDYDSDTTGPATVEDVRRNVRTIEVSLRDNETGQRRVLIMEGR